MHDGIGFKSMSNLFVYFSSWYVSCMIMNILCELFTYYDELMVYILWLSMSVLIFGWNCVEMHVKKWQSCVVGDLDKNTGRNRHYGWSYQVLRKMYEEALGSTTDRSSYYGWSQPTLDPLFCPFYETITCIIDCLTFAACGWCDVD